MEKLIALKNHFFFSQPHQPFFVLAFINALFSMFLFMLLFKGVVSGELSSNTYHIYSLFFLFFTPLFLGFLMTTFPKFFKMSPVAPKEYLMVFGFFVAGFLLFQLGALFSYLFANIGMLLVLLGQLEGTQILWRIYRSAESGNREDQKWMMIALLFGIIAHVLFIVSVWLPIFHTLTVQIGVYLYLFLLAFVIAQRMVPFFSHTPVQRHKERFKVIVGLLGLHIILELIESHSSFLADFLIGYLIGREIFRWNLPFPNPHPLLWILHLALFWIPVSFFISGITDLIALSNGSNFLFINIHTLILGFLVTILIGFGTRVTLGHAGKVLEVDKWTVLLFYWTQVVVVVRIFTSLSVANGWNVLTFFDLSVTVWLVLFGLWGSRFFRVLVFGK